MWIEFQASQIGLKHNNIYLNDLEFDYPIQFLWGGAGNIAYSAQGNTMCCGLGIVLLFATQFDVLPARMGQGLYLVYTYRDTSKDLCKYPNQIKKIIKEFNIKYKDLMEATYEMIENKNTHQVGVLSIDVFDTAKFRAWQLEFDNKEIMRLR